MSLRQKIAVLTGVFTGVLLGLALAIDAWLVTPWMAAMVPEPDAAQHDALLHGAAARRVALVWLALVAFSMSCCLADRILGRPLKRLAAEVSRRRVSGPAWAESTPHRIDEIGVIAREFGQTYDELKALRGSSARADALEQQLARMHEIGFAVGQLAVSARRLGLAVEAGEDQLEVRLQSLTDEVAALREMTRDARGVLPGATAPSETRPTLSPVSEPALESPAAPDASLSDPLPEAEPC